MAGDGQKAQAIAQPIVDTPPPTADDGQFTVSAPVAPMREAPNVESSEVDNAISTLTELGGEHAALVQKWGSDASENLAYAKEAFKDIVTNRPDLIAKVDANGLGNDPAVLEFLAQHGRLKSGMMGDFHVARKSAPSYDEPRMVVPRGKSAAQVELDAIYKRTPPGSPGYREKSVQDRIRRLTETLAGPGSAVGHGGRTI